MLTSAPPYPKPGSRSIRRYSAYFPNWAQAFDEHELIDDHTCGLRWLVGPQQLGFILTADSRRQLYALLLGRHAQPPPSLKLTVESLQLGTQSWALEQAPAPIPTHLRELLTDQHPLHLFQSYHLIFPTGTRILTLSKRAPLPLIYREIEPIELVTVA